MSFNRITGICSVLALGTVLATRWGLLPFVLADGIAGLLYARAGRRAYQDLL